MELSGKYEELIQLKSPPDKFYKILISQMHEVPNASEHVHSVEVHEGDWETHGSVKQWTYTIDGKPEVFKEKVEIDEAAKTLSLTAVEGHVLEQYKSYKGIFQVSPKEGEGLVKLTIEYEKLKADDTPPRKYMDFVVNLLKDLDAHLVKA